MNAVTVDPKAIASTADTVLKDFMQVEPFVATAAGMFPQAAPIVALVHPAVAMAAPFVEKALEAIAAGNNGDAFGSFVQLLQHLTPGQPNAAVLSTPVAAPLPQAS
jgi:hypothetical protein